MEKRGSSQTARLMTPLFVCFILLNLLGSTMAQMNTVGSPLLSTKVMGTSVYGGFLVAVFVVASIVSRIVSGNLADRYSRRGVLMSGTLIYLLGCLIAMVVPSMLSLIPARVLQGWGFAAVHTAASTGASDVLPSERLGEGLGYYALGQAVAMASGPLLAGWLVGMQWQQALAAGAAVLSLAVLAISLLITYEKHPQSLPESSAYRRSCERGEGCAPHGACDGASSRAGGCSRFKLCNLFERAALRGGIPIFVISGGVTVFLSFATIYGQEQEYANPGGLFIVAAVAAIAVRLFGSRLLDSGRPLLVFLIPVVACAVGLAVMWAIRSEAVFCLCGVGYGVCLGFAIPQLSSLSVRYAPVERYGAANALFSALYDAGIGVFALVWGALHDAFGFGAVFACAEASLVLTYLIALALFPHGAAEVG